MSYTPRFIYIWVIVLGTALFIADHVTSPISPTITMPNADGSACAPCGAPCNPNDT